MKIAGIQETYLLRLQGEFEELPESFRAKVKQARWEDFVIMPVLYWDPKMMEEIIIAVKWNGEKVKIDVATIHEVIRLSKEGETPAVTKKSEVDRETWIRELCALDTQVYAGGIRIMDISDRKLQWAAKILVYFSQSKSIHTSLEG